jgi:hypothetical protein
VQGSGVKTSRKHGATVINFQASSKTRVVDLSCDLTVYLLDRYEAYNYWVISLPNDPVSGNHTNATYFESAPIVRTDYLLRTAEISDGCIHLTGDLNATSDIEVVGGAPAHTTELTWNGQSIPFKQNRRTGVVTATATFEKPTFSVPSLTDWKVVDSLPEIKNGYDDSLWTSADLTYTNNTVRNLTTPTSLYGVDYGYVAGSLIYRGHFRATGNESTFYLNTQGGSAFGHSVWLNSTFIASFYGADKYSAWNETYDLPSLKAGENYVFTILIDHMGLDEDGAAGQDGNKNPRGVLDYTLAGHAKSDVSWKLTGNLHGEDYEDKTRGPLNEGALYAERQGWHLPGAPTGSWATSQMGPMEGLTEAGVKFYSKTFDLNMPAGYDIPLSFSFSNATLTANGTVPSYRVQLYVNGYQFGKYVHNIGPQDVSTSS